MQYFSSGWYPVTVPKELIDLPHVGKASTLTPAERAQIVKDHGKSSLRQLANRYGVSYETIRQAIIG